MRITLRSFVLTPVVMAAAVLTAHSAMAETKLDVPFNFSVNGKACPAGEYKVIAADQDNRVVLAGASHSFTWILHPGEPAPTDRRIILKFDELGENHVLRSVQYHNQVTSRLDKHAQEMESASIRVVQGQ
jgi:hypothetical protein